MSKIKNVTGFTLLIIISVFSIPLIVWNFTFGFVAGVYLLAVFVGLWYLYFKKRKFWFIPAALVIGFVGYMLFLPWTTAKLNRKQDEYYTKLKQTKKLNTLEKWNIYGLSITTAIVGLPFSPEASYEVLLMMFPDKDKVRVAHSGFFMGSKKLMAAMEKNDKGHFHWGLKDYYISSPESRYSLALNPVDYEVKRYKERVEYTVKVPIHWHYGVDVMLNSKYVTIKVNESLFKYLEDNGWLHMYWMVWKHTEYLD